MSAKAPGGFRDVVDLGATQHDLGAKEILVTFSSSISHKGGQHAFAGALVESGHNSSSSAKLP